MNKILLLILLIQIHGVISTDWGYSDKDGPDTWEGTCSTGLRQSPIDIRASDVDYALLNRLHFVHYDHSGKAILANNGHTVSMSGFTNWTLPPYVMGGAMKGKYYLQQFHLHWGQRDDEGSEHRMGGLAYPAELHLVHFKEGISARQAMEQGDGIVVVGVFLQVHNNGEPIAAMANALEDVIEPGDSEIVETFRPRNVLPEQTDAYYHYEGSLTTPGCNEAVQWYVLSEPIPITQKQLIDLRRIHNHHEEAHKYNYRPPQPLHGRRVLFRPVQYNRAKFCGSSSSTLLSILPFALLAIVIGIRL